MLHNNGTTIAQQQLSKWKQSIAQQADWCIIKNFSATVGRLLYDYCGQFYNEI